MPDLTDRVIRVSFAPEVRTCFRDKNESEDMNIWNGHLEMPYPTSLILSSSESVKIMLKVKDNTKTKTLTRTLGTQPHQLQDTKYQYKDKFTPMQMQIQSSLVPLPTCSWTSGYMSIGEPI